MKTIIITGGAGFVGSNLATLLSGHLDDVNIVVLDNLMRKGSELNLDRLKKSGIQFVRGDIRSQSDLNALPKPDLIIDCSAEPSVLAGIDGSSPTEVISINLNGTINILEWARSHHAQLIFLSTSRVYPYDVIDSIPFVEQDTRFAFDISKNKIRGITPAGLTEDFPLDGIRSIYGATKLASELFINEYRQAFKMPAIINRCGVIAGPWQMGKVDQGFMSLWVARHFFKNKLNFIGYGGEGKQVRDVLHVHDLFDLILIQIKALDAGQHQGTYNVGGSFNSSCSLKELTTICENITGHKMAIDKQPDTRPADMRIYLTDNSKVTKTFGWAPKKSVKDVAVDTFDWIKDNQKMLEGVFNS